jgi:outer membrane protein assembly factor BamD (BamD/ComL family)
MPTKAGRLSEHEQSQKAKADAQYRQGNTEAALTEYVDHQNQHPGDDWPLFEQVKLLEQFERFSEAITILAEIEQRFGASSLYRNAKIVGKFLCKKDKLLEK